MGMKPEKTYVAIARTLASIHWIEQSPATYSESAHGLQSGRLVHLMDSAPSGSGFDAGIELLESESSPDKLVFRADFHHMNDSGYYDGWTHHRVIVRPSLEWGFVLRITGRNRRGIKEWIEQVLGAWLDSDAPSPDAPRDMPPRDMPPDLAF